MLLMACGDNEHEHTLVAVDGTAATCTEVGVADHYRCSDCGKLFSDALGNSEVTDASIPALGHTGGEATCQNKAVCTRCNQGYGELKEHNFGAFEQTLAPTCTDAGERTSTCSKCGETKSEEIPASGHAGDWRVVAEPRCFDDGEEQLICTICDALVEKSIPSFELHDLQDSTCVGGKQCTRCNYAEGTGNGHAFDDWQITKSANCTEDGTKERKCLVCDYKESGIVLRTGHTGDWSYVTEPTCTENGEQGRMCTSCSHYETKIAYKTGHSGEWSVTTEATCTSNGEQQRVCTECGQTEKSVIAKGHSYGDWSVTNEPSCTQGGTQTRYCSGCGFTQDSPVGKTGHSMTWDVTQEPTCTENGVKVGTCTVCGQNENAVAEKLGHDLQGGTCVDPTRCTRCGYAVMNTHVYGEAYEIIWPDCERHGIMNQKCAVCEDVYQYHTQPVGHTYSDWEIRVAPTCTELGRERRQCTVCGKAQDQSVPLEDHTLGDWIILEEADCTSDGLRHKICTSCQGVMAEEIIPALGHDFADATCADPRTCKRCFYTEGERLGEHLLEYNADIDRTVCSSCNALLLTDKFAVFTLSDDGNSYWITFTTDRYNYTSEKDFSGVILPDTYEGKPVTAVMSMYADRGYAIELYQENLFIPKTIQFVGDYAFGSYNSKLKRVFVENGSSLKSIGNFAFRSCRFLEYVELPEGLVEIGNNAFESCSSLTEVAFPSTLESIGDCAFRTCTSLTSAHLPSNLKIIGGEAFGWCEALVSVTLPDGAPDIDSSTFTECNNIQYTVLKDGLKYLGSSTNSYLFLLGAEPGITSAMVEPGCAYIGRNAFNRCLQLQYVILPEGLKVIGGYAFGSCPLVYVIIPSSLEFLGSNAFDSNCDEDIVYYLGTYEQWQSIAYPEWEECLPFDGEYICYYSETEPSYGADGRRYWHYDENGNPTAWS